MLLPVHRNGRIIIVSPTGARTLAGILGDVADEPFNEFRKISPEVQRYKQAGETKSALKSAVESLFNRHRVISHLYHQLPRNREDELLSGTNQKVIHVRHNNMVGVAEKRAKCDLRLSVDSRIVNKWAAAAARRSDSIAATLISQAVPHMTIVWESVCDSIPQMTDFLGVQFDPEEVCLALRASERRLGIAPFLG